MMTSLHFLQLSCIGLALAFTGAAPKPMTSIVAHASPIAILFFMLSSLSFLQKLQNLRQ